MSEKIKKCLISVILCSIICRMDMIKKAIKEELKRRGWSTYRLVKELKGKIPDRTVYSYLSDDEDNVNTRDISAPRAGIILQALGLKIKR